MFGKSWFPKKYTEFVGFRDQLVDVLTKSLRGPQIEYIYSSLTYTICMLEIQG